MKEDFRKVKTFKKVYPQIYSYILPDRHENDGWQKIGYTERENVDERIREQTKTAAFNERYEKLWNANAIYEPFEKGEFFNDHKLHEYLVKSGIRKDEGRGKEWFFFNGTPEKSKQLFDNFRKGNYVDFANPKNKIKYILRREQTEAVEMTLDYAAKNQTVDFSNPNEKAEFLWNAKPRFGKTLTTYDFAKKLGARSVLIVTNRAAITNSWFDDFEKFIDGYYFISTADSLRERKTLSRDDFNRIPELDKKQITFLSLQDLKGAKTFGGKFNKLEYVAEINWDLLVIDEAHEGVDTNKTDVAFEKIKRKFTLHLSGTPFRALANGKFAESQIFNWTYIDEQRAKKSEIESGDEFGDHFDMPDMRLFTYKMSDIVLSDLEKGVEIQGENIDYAFDLNEFFATNERGDFIHEKEVRIFPDRLTSNEKYPFSTPELREELRHTFWWVGRKVASAKAMEKMLRNHPVFGRYEIILAAGDGRKLSENDDFEKESENFDRNEKALDRVKKAIVSNDKTITLSVGQLTTGVTIKEWSAVLMLTEIKSESTYTQAIFRAQNPHKYFKNGQIFRKKSAYVFDFSPGRVLETYDKLANSLVAQTAQGRTTEKLRSDNVAELLNFFPVIAEDESGKMVELNAEQVLTFPKAIIAQDVVKARFMTNLLFKNIGTVYNIPSEVRKATSKLANTKQDGKPSKTKTDVANDPNRGERTQKRISANRQYIFGQKVYGEQIANIIDESLGNGMVNFEQNFVDRVWDETVEKPFGLWVETYNPTKKEAQETKDSIKEKLYELSAEFVSTKMDNSDKKDFAEKISSFIEEELPRDMVDEREEAEFEKQEKSDLDIIKEKLKTFSRAIPSMVMASKNPKELTIDNIEEVLSDEDFAALFTEVGAPEPFTKADFRLLRDGTEYIDEETGEKKFFDGFFDKYVFNAAIQEFEKKRSELQDYLRTTAREDIFTYIPAQKSNQIFTPRKVVNQMLNILEKENPGIFMNPKITFADLYVKSGLYLTEIAKRLYRGLETQIPDENARLKHIFEKQLYGFAPTQIIHDIAENYIYRGFENVGRDNLKFKDLTPDFKEGKTLNMKFDVVIGNPPYQDEAKSRSEQPPIYHHFMENAYKISNKVCLITPARFLFNVGGTPRVWNEKMLDDNHLRVDFFEQKSEKVFPGTDIKGGVAITYRDAQRNFGKIGTFTHFEELNSITKKVLTESDKSLADIYYSNTAYKYSPLFFSENIGFENRVSGGSKRYMASSVFEKFPEVFLSQPKDDGREYIKIIGRKNNQRTTLFFDKEYINPPENFYKFKVLLPGSNGSGAIGEVLSTPLVGEPLVGHTETFISFGAFETREEAENLLKYIKTKFARTMLGVRKVTQGNKNAYVWGLVPLQNFTPDSDIDWSKSIPEIDRQLYKKYGLSEQEIAFIEEKVRAME